MGKITKVNIALILINIAYFLFLEFVGSTEDSMTMVRYGALLTSDISDTSQMWRLITAMFMHFGVNHLANNMLILFLLGSSLEKALGSIKYLILYLLSGIGANAITLYTYSKSEYYVISAGASGAVFGVVGALLVIVGINKGELEELSTGKLIVMLGFALYYGFTSSEVNNIAHIAGALIGMLLAVLLYRRKQ